MNKLNKILPKVPNSLRYKGGTIKRLIEYYDNRPNVAKNMITGCPRSGTTYMAAILEMGMNIEMPHEYIGKDGVTSWQHIGGKEYRVKCDNILHQIREPLSVISSIAYVLSPWGFPFILYNIPYMDYSTDDIVRDQELKICFAMHIYEEWNNLIEERAVWRYKIEDMPEATPEIMKRLGFDPVQLFYPKEQRINDIPHSQLFWNDLDGINKEMADKVRLKAEKYRYL